MAPVLVFSDVPSDGLDENVPVAVDVPPKVTVAKLCATVLQYGDPE